jgi:hypothetical protein
MVLSFVDRDMIMRYFGGGIGHLGNSTQHQVDSEPLDTEPKELEEEMDISDDGGNNASGPGEVPEDIMNYEVENSDDEQGSGSDSSESDSDEDSDEGSGEDSDEDSGEGTIIDPASEDSDDDGYGSF